MSDIRAIDEVTSERQRERLFASLHSLICNPSVDEIPLVMSEVIAILRPRNVVAEAAVASPWHVEVEANCDDQQADIYVCHPGTVCDATVVCTMGTSADVLLAQKLANAARIAAAPEMLAALRAIAEGNLGDAPWQANYAKIREIANAAIVRATPE